MAKGAGPEDAIRLPAHELGRVAPAGPLDDGGQAPFPPQVGGESPERGRADVLRGIADEYPGKRLHSPSPLREDGDRGEPDDEGVVPEGGTTDDHVAYREVKRFDEAHAELLRRIAGETFTVLHRIDAHILQPKESS